MTQRAHTDELDPPAAHAARAGVVAAMPAPGIRDLRPAPRVLPRIGVDAPARPPSVRPALSAVARPVRRAAVRLARIAADLLPALLLYAAVRGVGLLALVLVGRANGVDGPARLYRADAQWLVAVAAGGYDDTLTYAADGSLLTKNPAFFPLVPALMNGLSVLTGWNLVTSGFVLTAVAGLAAAAALDRIGRHVLGGRTAGLVLVGLWASWPHAVVLLMPYTEAPFVALAAWALHCVLRERWVLAGTLALLAGATRPTGTALAAAVVLCALVAVVRRRGVWRPLLGAALAPLGFLGYWWWLGRRLGRPDAWFVVQDEAWGSRFDGGRYEYEAVLSALSRPTAMVLTLCALVVVGSLVLLVALLVQRTPLPLLLYAACVVAMTVGTAGYANSKPRFLLAAFPLLLPLARALAAGPRRTAAVLVAGAAVASGWYGAYLLILWRYSP